MKNLLVLTLITFVILSCVKTSDYTINDGLLPDDIITISEINPVEVYADSSTEVLVRVKINANSSANQSVTLTTTAGLINGSSKSESITTNTDRYADFKLTAGQAAGPVFLKATVLTDYSRDTIINFLKAYPDSIIINPEKFVIDKNTTLPIEINLFRYKGYPSAGQNIFYSATTSGGEKAGTIIPDGEFAPGNKVNAVFTPNQDLEGDVFITVTVLTEDGSKMDSSIKIKIQ